MEEFLEAFSVTIDETLPVLQFLANDPDRVLHTDQAGPSKTPAPAPARPGGQH